MQRWLLSIAGALAMVVSAALSPTSAKAAEYDWRIAVGYPRDVALGKLYPEFARTIEEMSGGRIDVKVVYDGEGVNQEEIYGAVKSGLVQIGFPYMALFSGEFPAGMVELGLPGGPSEYVELRSLFHTTKWKEVLREAYAERGLYLLGEEHQLPTYLLTKEPVETLDDLEGKKIRAPGAYGKFFRSLGATPVSMAYDEVYTGLATGVIWGVDAMNIVDHHGGKFHEIAKHLYPLPITGSQVFPILVNKDAWGDLPKDLQEVLRGAANWHTTHVAVSVREMETEALNEMRDGGLQEGPAPSAKDSKRWTAAGQAIWSEYETDATSKQLIQIQKKFMSRLGY